MNNDNAYPICPICGSNADYFYIRDGKVLGCSDCLPATLYTVIRERSKSWEEYLAQEDEEE